MNLSPLYSIYQKYHAKIVDFHGWALPVQFSSIIQEHQGVRNQVGLFDVSHMGEILVRGPESLPFLDYVLTNQISGIQPGNVRYSPLCFETGGTVDDLLIYALKPDEYLLVVNASNIQKDFEYLTCYSSKFQVILTDLSAETAQLAIQGPKAHTVLSLLTKTPLATMGYYQFIDNLDLAGFSVLISRTGYTGEDGFELYLQPDQALSIWEILMETGETFGITPAGLGARDTLRFEAGLPLYGNELSDTISPVEAGLKRFIKLEKPNFLGKGQLEKELREGTERSLIGLCMVDRGIPRTGYKVFSEEKEIGFVTSGSYCPTLNQNYAMALVETAYTQPDLTLSIDIRGKIIHAKTVKLPFYSRLKGAPII
jgi:aminomethyltransferase